MQNVYKNIDECKPSRKYSVLIIFDDMITHMISNKNFGPIVTELFFRGRKRNICAALITCLTVNIFIKKNRKNRELAFNQSSDIGSKAVINSLQDFINRYKNILQNHVIDTTLALGNPLHYRRNF